MDHKPRDLEWQRRYEQNDAPWDKGSPAPPLVKFLREGRISGRVLVPGCGRGHEVRALAAQPNTTALGLDLSATAVAQARELSGKTGPGSNIDFITGDFFNLPANLRNSFNWVVEHTCFCAIEPRLRLDYVLGAKAALAPGGRIFAIFYLNPDTESGPPFAVSEKELTALFEPHFTLLEKWVPAEAFPGREGRELVCLLQKRAE